MDEFQNSDNAGAWEDVLNKRSIELLRRRQNTKNFTAAALECKRHIQ